MKKKSIIPNLLLHLLFVAEKIIWKFKYGIGKVWGG